MILWWAWIIVGVVALGRWLMTSQQSGAPEKSAIDILKERYARSEIDREEFETKRRDLEP